MSLRSKLIFVFFTFLLLLILFISFKYQESEPDFTSSNLPLIFIDTQNGTIVDDPKIKATMGIVWNGPGKRNGINDPRNSFNGNIMVEIRGSTSQMFPKKSYGFETKSTQLADMNVSLLGMPEENDWVLYAPYTDKTLIRDVLTLTLDASLGHYSPRCRYVELFINNNYEGVYVLMEKIKRNKNRVNIAKLSAMDISDENLTGGYIIKIDKTTGGSSDGWISDYFNNTNKTFYQYEYPKSKEINPEQKTYIQSYIRSMETALYHEKYTGTGNYHEYLNDSSFVDFMIINELSKNIDGYRLSSYLFKEKNDKMNCGPVWDLNSTYGCCNYYNGGSPLGFVYQVDCSGDKWQIPFWWNKLMKDPDFVLKVKKRWTQIREHGFSNERISYVADSLVSLLAEAKVRNFKRWPDVIGKRIGPNYYIGPTYESEVNWMKNWISQRLAFLDEQWYDPFPGNKNQTQTISVFSGSNSFSDHTNVFLHNSVAELAVVKR